jgi:hypothetical protein
VKRELTRKIIIKIIPLVYRYETGMKEPEIYVEGDATQET